MSDVKHTEERTKTHECVCERTETHDLISRKAAINAINSWFEKAKHPMNRGSYNNGELAAYSTAISEIENLSSAEPEQEIYAKMSDEEFEKWLYEHGICHPDIHETIPCKAVQLLIDYAINELPHTEPERHGRWLKAYGEHEAMGIRPFYRYCSRCNEAAAFPYKYCPNCGADMRGEQNG